MKSTQDKFRLVNDGKMLKKDFLTEVKRTHSDMVHSSTTYKDAVQILKNKNIINEHYLGIVTQKPVNNVTHDWFKIFNDNVLKEDEENVKAELKNPDKEVVELETKGYDYKDKDNVNNMNFNEYLTGYYCELKNPENADKTEAQLKEIVSKNLEKNPLHYVEEGQFGIEGIGYTEDAPGLAPSKSDQMVPVKEGHINLGDLINENWINPSAEVNEDEGSYYEEDDITIHDDNVDPTTALGFDVTEEEEVKETPKPAKKLSLEARLREIENLGKSTALEAKIQAVAEEITSRQDKLQVAETMEEVAEFINPVRVKEMRKEIKLLEKKRTMYERMYKKLTKEDYKAPIVDEELTTEDTEATPEV